MSPKIMITLATAEATKQTAVVQPPESKEWNICFVETNKVVIPYKCPSNRIDPSRFGTTNKIKGNWHLPFAIDGKFRVRKQPPEY